jgi:hypothetical protein
MIPNALISSTLPRINHVRQAHANAPEFVALRDSFDFNNGFGHLTDRFEFNHREHRVHRGRLQRGHRGCALQAKRKPALLFAYIVCEAPDQIRGIPEAMILQSPNCR